MKVKRMHTEKTLNIAYSYWTEHILEKHLESNYEILEIPDLVDIFEIDIATGNRKFVETCDRSIGMANYISNSDKYTIENTSAKFDSNFRMTRRPKGSDRSHFPNIPDLLDFELNITPKKEILMYNKIFISHSSEDSAIVKQLVNIIELVIGIDSDIIFCSSLENYGIRPGDNILESLKRELNDKILVLFVLSDNFYKSQMCLCELGATWVKTTKHIPVIIPPFNFKRLDWILDKIKGIIINEAIQINQLKKELELAFSTKKIDPSKWEDKRNSYIEIMNLEIRKSQAAANIG